MPIEVHPARPAAQGADGIDIHQNSHVPVFVRAMSLISTILLVGLSAALAVPDEAQNSSDARHFFDNAASNLGFIGSYFRRAPLHEMVHFSADSKVIVTSAEAVIGEGLLRQGLPEHCLVSYAHRKNVEPLNPSASSELEKWGSSYNSWLMSSNRWKLAEQCPWRFPLLWDKRPDLYGGKVNVLWLDGARDVLATNEFAQRMVLVQRWLNPDSVDPQELISQLGSPSDWERVVALRFLGARRDKQFIPEIAKCLVDKHIRTTAVWALGWIGAPEGVELLAPLAQDPDWALRKEVAKALARIGADSAFELVFKLGKDQDREVRRDAIEALADFTSLQVIPALKEALQDPDQSVRRTAQKALENAGRRETH